MPKEKKEKESFCSLCGGCDPNCVCLISKKKKEKNVEKTAKKINNFKHLCFIH